MNKIGNTRRLGASAWPEYGVERIDRCPVCDADDSEIWHSELTDGVFFCAPGEWTLMRCRSCGSGYLNPRPTPDTIELAYRVYFTHESESAAGNRKVSGRHWFRRVLGNGYRNWRFGTSYEPAMRCGVLAVLIDRDRRARIDASMRHLPRPREGQKLLDFGCGNGAFMRRARDAGWDVVGLDVDEKAVRVAKEDGLEVYQGGQETVAGWVGEFDVITLSHVIEHVHDPESLLRTCHNALKIGGSLWIETPNVESQGHRIYGPDWRGLEVPRHLVLFTPQSLTGLLRRCGFRSIKNRPEHPVISSMFGASEAIRARQDPIAMGRKWAEAGSKRWKGYRREARKNPGVREFITVVAEKPDDAFV